jgi:hypothetical protein|nr:MAG TPA: tail assembly chaperone protein [Caudoviricetes sp.]
MNTKKFPKITIDGKQYPTRTSMGAMLRYTRETGNDTLEFQTLSDTITYLWCCVVSACSAEGVPFDLDLMSFADRLAPEDVTGWTEALEASTQTTEAEGGAKKK